MLNLGDNEGCSAEEILENLGLLVVGLLLLKLESRLNKSRFVLVLGLWILAELVDVVWLLPKFVMLLLLGEVGVRGDMGENTAIGWIVLLLL